MKIKDEKRLVEIIMRVWENGQYSQDLSTDLLIDGSFEYDQSFTFSLPIFRHSAVNF